MMMTKAEVKEHLAWIKFQLYATHGIGKFNNWLDLKEGRIEREEVLDALTFEPVRKLAEVRLAKLKKQAIELEELLAESLNKV